MEPGRELIPTRWRIPFFIALAVVSLIALGLLVTFVVVPGINAQQSGAAGVRESGLDKVTKEAGMPADNPIIVALDLPRDRGAGAGARACGAACAGSRWA